MSGHSEEEIALRKSQIEAGQWLTDKEFAEYMAQHPGAFPGATRLWRSVLHLEGHNHPELTVALVGENEIESASMKWDNDARRLVFRVRRRSDWSNVEVMLNAEEEE